MTRYLILPSLILLCVGILLGKTYQDNKDSAPDPKLDNLTICMKDNPNNSNGFVATNCSTGEPVEQLFLISNVWTDVASVHWDYSKTTHAFFSK